ncbi:MAG: polysaccharide deacetylase family protein [Pirellulaceae bacterium]
MMRQIVSRSYSPSTHATVSNEAQSQICRTQEVRSAGLRVIGYHYVRDLPRTRFPRIKGMLLDSFRRQVQGLCQRYEMASLESALEFLAGRFVPSRDLCLLTFDDGLKEHFSEVTPILEQRKIQGLFFLSTVCIEEQQVVLVHKNHFLMAALGFEEYQRAFLQLLEQRGVAGEECVKREQACETYRFDTPEVAVFKYLLNFVLAPNLRSELLNEMFPRYLGDEAAFARELYVSWDEARAMQDAGMVIGGHSHQHVALATLSLQDQREDLLMSTRLLHRHLAAQPSWPFCYPYGNPVDAFTADTVALLQELRYCCAFTTCPGVNNAGEDVFRIRRIDTTEVGF